MGCAGSKGTEVDQGAAKSKPKGQQKKENKDLRRMRRMSNTGDEHEKALADAVATEYTR